MPRLTVAQLAQLRPLVVEFPEHGPAKVVYPPPHTRRRFGRFTGAPPGALAPGEVPRPIDPEIDNYVVRFVGSGLNIRRSQRIRRDGILRRIHGSFMDTAANALDGLGEGLHFYYSSVDSVGPSSPTGEDVELLLASDGGAGTFIGGLGVYQVQSAVGAWASVPFDVRCYVPVASGRRFGLTSQVTGAFIAGIFEVEVG